jgi:hypothetical protein
MMMIYLKYQLVVVEIEEVDFEGLQLQTHHMLIFYGN